MCSRWRSSFQVSVDEPGQLELTLNGNSLAYTVVGRATGSSQIVGEALVTVTSPDLVLTVRNPSTGDFALTITQDAGGNSASSASLIIQKLG